MEPLRKTLPVEMRAQISQVGQVMKHDVAQAHHPQSYTNPVRWGYADTDAHDWKKTVTKDFVPPVEPLKVHRRPGVDLAPSDPSFYNYTDEKMTPNAHASYSQLNTLAKYSGDNKMGNTFAEGSLKTGI